MRSETEIVRTCRGKDGGRIVLMRRWTPIDMKAEVKRCYTKKTQRTYECREDQRSW